MASVERERKNKGGRPPNPEGSTLSKTMNFRVLPALYEQIAASAKIEGRSISEEVAARLAWSFRQDEIERVRFGDPSVAFLANLFASILNSIQIRTGKSCMTDRETNEATMDALDAILSASSAGLFKEIKISNMRKRFDMAELKKIKEPILKNAEAASIDPLPLSEIMGR